MKRNIATISVGLLVTACGGSANVSTPPVVASPPPPPVSIWADVTAAVDAAPTADIHLVIGDAQGEIFSYEKGSLPRNETHRLASASKLLTGITIVRMIEAGTMSLGDNPQNYITWWTSDGGDDRSLITLEDLLSFKSGFNYKPGLGGCVNNGNISLEDCARDYYDGDVASTPGDVYYYGPAHLQVAAYMAQIASGVSYVDLFKAQVATPLNLSAATGFVSPSLTNPRASAGAQSTVADYSEILRALLAGELITDLTTFTLDRTDNASFGHRPKGIEDANVDWHYGLGFWRECEFAVWDNSCANHVVISSPGAFGWNPWVDLEENYYGLIAMDVPLTIDNGTVDLEITLRPLIVAALAKR